MLEPERQTMRMHRSLMFSGLFLFAYALTSAPDVHAFKILGCSFNFGHNPEGSINDKVNDRINQVQNDSNHKIDDVPIVDNLQKDAILFLTESYIKETRLAVEHYNVSVRELAEASVRPR